jgi:predicted TIM-barrel fold metal-dependent hydrolase
LIIDAHAHFEPRLINEAELLRMMDEKGVETMALVPRMHHPPEHSKPAWMMVIQRFLFRYDLLRPIGIAITQSMYKDKGKWSLGPLGWLMKNKSTNMEIIQRPENEMVREVVDRYPKRFLQWLMVNLSEPDALQTLKKDGARQGVIGIKLHPFWHRFPLNAFDTIAGEVKRLNLPVTIHLGYGSSGDFKSLVDKHPDQIFIFGHLGVPYYGALWREIKDRPNCYVDISSVYHVDAKLIRQAVEILGADRVLFASDEPYTPKGTLDQLMRWVRGLEISEPQKQKIFAGNAQRIFARPHAGGER